MNSKESVPPSEAEQHLAVCSDQDTEPEVETYTAVDGSLITRRVRSIEHRERSNAQAGPSQPAGQPQAAGPPAHITREEFVKFMTNFRGEIKDLITKRSSGSNKGQSARKPSRQEKAKSVKDREHTPHPTQGKGTRTPVDLSRLHLPEPGKKKAIRQDQPDGSKRVISDARLIIEQRRSQQLSDSGSTSTYKDSFRNASLRNSISMHASQPGVPSVHTGPHVIGSAPYSPFAQPYMQQGLFGGQAAYNVQPMDWQLRLLRLGEQPSAFSKDIAEAAQPSKVKNVMVGTYDGTTNPEDHLLSYTHLMYLQGLDDAAWCKCFPATLKGVAQQWFGNLPAGCINNFRTLAFLFASNFSMNIPAKKTSLDLGAVQQGEKEGLRSYVRRFNLVRIQIQGLSDEVAYTDFFKGLKDGSTFKFDLVRKRVATLQEALREAEAYIQATDLCSGSKQSDSKKSDKQKGSRQDQPAHKAEKRKDVWAVDDSRQPSQKKKKKAEFKPYEPKYEFNKDCHSILMEIRNRLSIEKPAPMKSSVSKRNQDTYCHFHEDIGHDTNDCYSLKRLLDRLADKGVLKSYISKSKAAPKKDPRQASKKPAKPASSSDTDQDPICTIAGGFAAGGPTIRGTKDHVRRLDVSSVDEGQAAADTFPDVVITEKDRGNVRRPHDDPIVIECKVANQKVGRILIDTGSSSDIISYKCLSKLKYRPGSMHDVTHPLVGFGGGVVQPVGRIDLPIRLGEKGEGRHMVVQFLVVEELSAYNIILGRPTLNQSKAVIIPALMLLKFEKDDGSVGSLSGDQKTARECYLSDVKPTAASAGKGKEPIDLDDVKEQAVLPAPPAAGRKRKADQLVAVKKEKQ